MAEKIYVAKESTSQEILALLSASGGSEDILPAHWLSHYKLFGEDSYVYQSRETWKALCMSKAAINDLAMNGEALESMTTEFSAEHLGKWMLCAYGMTATELEGLASMAAIAANSNAMAAVAENEILMNAILNSETAWKAITASSTAMSRIAASDTAMSALMGNTAAMKVAAASSTAMSALTASSTAMNTIITNDTGMSALTASSTAMTAAAASSTAMNAICGNEKARDAVLKSAYYDSCMRERDMAIAKIVASYAGLSAASYASMSALTASSTAMNKVIADSTAMSALAGSGTAVNAILASSTAMNKVITDSTAMSALAASGTAMSKIAANSTVMSTICGTAEALRGIALAYESTAGIKPFLLALNADGTLISKAYATLTAATTLFTEVQLGYYASASSMDSNTTKSTAPKAFLACACGYYSDSSDGVRIAYNGDVIADKTGFRRPTSVSSTNVNAITMAPSTFTGKGSGGSGGYIATERFTAQ